MGIKIHRGSLDVPCGPGGPGRLWFRTSGYVCPRNMYTFRGTRACTSHALRARSVKKWNIAGFTGFVSYRMRMQLQCTPDRIQARHPSSPIRFKQKQAGSPFPRWSAGSSTTHDACQRCVVDFCEGAGGGPANAGVSDYPNAIRGYDGSQCHPKLNQIGIVSCRKRVVETKFVVKYQKGIPTGYQTSKLKL